MSYGKRDEDAEQAIVKVDRTSVFQEGGQFFPGMPQAHADRMQHDYSTPHLCRRENAVYS